MKKLILKLFLLTLVLGAFAIPGKAHAILGTWLGCANWYCGAEAEDPDFPDGIPTSHETLAQISENVCYPTQIGLPVDPTTGDRIPFDWAAMGLNANACRDALNSCEDDYLDCMKDNCEQDGNTWYCTPADSNSCAYIREASGVEEDCQPAFLDPQPSQPAPPAGPCDGLSGNELQECQNWQALAALSPEEQQQLKDLAALAALSPEQQQFLRDLDALANLSPEEQQQLRDLAALAALSPEQQQQLRDLAALANLSPEEQQQLRDLAALAGLDPDQQQLLRDLAVLASLTPEQQEQLREFARQQAEADSAPHNIDGVDRIIDQEPDFTFDTETSGAGGCSLQVAEAGNLSNLFFMLVGLLPLAVTGIRKK